MTVLALAQLRGGSMRPKVGTLIEPSQFDEGRLRTFILGGEIGFRVLPVQVTPDELALPVRRVRNSAQCHTLVSLDAEQVEADKQAAEEKASERQANTLRQARSELAEAQADHSAARKRMVEAQEAVNDLKPPQDTAAKGALPSLAGC